MIKKIAILALPMVMLVSSCNAQKADDTNVTVEQAAEMAADKDVVVIDVRTPEEYEKGHLEGATLINFYGEDFSQKINELPKDQKYLVYCHSGGRSAKAVKQMEDAGFTDVHNMLGGWSAWQSKQQ